MPRSSQPSSEEWRRRIRESGLRSTTARVAVLEELQKATAPLSHGDLAETLVPLGFDRATIYRNLVDLAEVGLLQRAELGDHVWRFELKRTGHDDENEHPHFVCVKCGEVTCMTATRLRLTPEPGSVKSQIGRLTEVLLRGLCARCN